MKWKNDPYIHEKNLVFDAIVKFSQTFGKKNIGDMAVKELSDFIDTFLKDIQLKGIY